MLHSVTLSLAVFSKPRCILTPFKHLLTLPAGLSLAVLFSGIYLESQYIYRYCIIGKLIVSDFLAMSLLQGYMYVVDTISVGTLATSTMRLLDP